MPNMRLVSDNVADTATVTASSQFETLPASNLKTDLKSAVWRASGTAATLTLTWPTPRSIRCVCLPFANFTSTARLQVKGYTNTTDTVAVADTGSKLACGYAPLGHFEWGNAPLGVNAFAYGGGAYGVIWFPIMNVMKLEILITDFDNTMGYIEAGRLVVGNYWEPQRNAEWGAQVGVEDAGTHERSHGGDLVTEAGSRHRKVAFNLANMSDGDRTSFVNYLRGYGKAGAVLFSLFPESTDPTLEQTYMVFGKLSASSSISAQYFNQYGAPVEIEEI